MFNGAGIYPEKDNYLEVEIQVNSCKNLFTRAFYHHHHLALFI